MKKTANTNQRGIANIGINTSPSKYQINTTYDVKITISKDGHEEVFYDRVYINEGLASAKAPD